MDTPPRRGPSLRRRLALVGIALAVATLASLAIMVVSDLRTRALIEDSRDQTVPRILEGQRAAANLERLIRFGWLTATAATPADWRQAAVTAQALSYHPSLAFEPGLRQKVVTVYEVIRQVLERRENAWRLRQGARTDVAQTPELLRVADLSDAQAREIWTPQEAILIGLQGRIADETARLTIDRYDQIADVASLVRRLALAVALLMLGALAMAATIVRRDLLAPVLRLSAAMGDTLAGRQPRTPAPTASTEEMATMAAAAAHLADALRQAALRESALKDSERRLTSIFAASEAAILLTDTRGRILQANAASLRLLGRAYVVDLELTALIHTSDRAGHAEDLATLLDGGSSGLRRDLRLLRADGSPLWVDCSIRAIAASEGHPAQLAVIAIDISDRVAALRELRFIRALVDQSADPIYCLDPADGGRMVWANAATCRHLGRPPEQITGLRVTDWDPKTSTAALEKVWADLRHHHTTTVFETRHQTGSGEVIPVEVSATWLEHDGHAYVAGYIRDIRQRNAMLEAVRRSNEDLQQFAYVASHDLQEPLRMVASFLQLLERHYGPSLDDNGREYIAFAVNGAVRMKRLIEDLLDFSRIDSHGQNLRPTDLGQAVQTAGDNLMSSIQEAGAEILVQAPLPVVMGDGGQLTRLLQNLIGNALKYRDRDHGRPLRVEISAERHGRFWQVCVADNGIGIAPEYHERVFMIFQRLHSAAAFEGTGIGLAVCKRIAERHGGRIWVESAENQGARFYFTLVGAEQ